MSTLQYKIWKSRDTVMATLLRDARINDSDVSLSKDRRTTHLQTRGTIRRETSSYSAMLPTTQMEGQHEYTTSDSIMPGIPEARSIARAFNGTSREIYRAGLSKSRCLLMLCWTMNSFTL